MLCVSMACPFGKRLQVWFFHICFFLWCDMRNASCTHYNVTIGNSVAFTASKIVVDREFLFLYFTAASKELLAKLIMTRGAFYLRNSLGGMRCWGILLWCVRISHSRLHACVPKMDIIKNKVFMRSCYCYYQNCLRAAAETTKSQIAVLYVRPEKKEGRRSRLK